MCLELNNVYGKDTMVNSDLSYIYHAIYMVMKLTGDVVDEGKFIYVDSWYKSVELSDEQGKHSTDVIGTVEKYWKSLPKDAMKAKLKKREGVSSLFTLG